MTNPYEELRAKLERYKNPTVHTEIADKIKSLDPTVLGNGLKQYLDESADIDWDGCTPEQVAGYFQLFDDLHLFITMVEKDN